MVNPQLVTYCESQIKLGATKEQIKSALIGAGWPAPDVEDSLNNVASPGRGISAQAAPAQKSAATISVNDLISNSSITAAPVKTTVAPAKGQPKIEDGERFVAPSKSHSSIILPIVLGLVAAICAAGAIYFYVQNKALQDKVSLLNTSSDSASAANAKVADLSAQIATLTKAQDDLKAQITALTDANSGFIKELSFFAIPPASASSTDAVPVDFTGVVGGGKVQYTVTDTNGVKVSVANSKNVKVDAVLKPLLGTSAQISGTHLLGSSSITVTSVNGVAIQ